ncbi:MAG: pyruvate kinase [Acidobacteria bacterium]|nr:pyruvate kinase [Acidobacteriota bacterium]
MTRRRDFRQTKIVCTLGPASASPECIEALARAGMNVARLNMSHGNHESHRQVIRHIQNLNPQLNHPVAILIDLQGPAIRTGERHGQLDLKVGQVLSITVAPIEDPEAKSIHVDYQDMVHQLNIGDRVTVDNGLINLEVLDTGEHELRCRVLDGGTLGSRKHINLPGVRVNLPSISGQDREDIRFALEQDADFLALSFVRNAEALSDARQVIDDAGGHHIRLIAKIENQEGLDNLEEITAAADGIMVARGDLGVEVEFAELPVAQRNMVRQCAVAGKPVILATHLLESMIDSPMPTRAEVTDVATAVDEQVDAVMLSGETATGKYPVRCVEVLDRIARRIEKADNLEFYKYRKPVSLRDHLARSACRLADSLRAPAVVVITRRGVLGQLVSSFRPQTAIVYAFTNSPAAHRQLWLCHSVVPFRMDLSDDPDDTIAAAFQRLRSHDRLEPGDPVVVVSDVAAGSRTVTAIQVRNVE